MICLLLRPGCHHACKDRFNRVFARNRRCASICIRGARSTAVRNPVCCGCCENVRRRPDVCPLSVPPSCTITGARRVEIRPRSIAHIRHRAGPPVVAKPLRRLASEMRSGRVVSNERDGIGRRHLQHIHIGFQVGRQSANGWRAQALHNPGLRGWLLYPGCCSRRTGVEFVNENGDGAGVQLRNSGK